MSQENIETIARLYDEFLAKPERLTSPELLAFFDPAVEIHQSESILGTQGTFHGYDGLEQVGALLGAAEPGLPRTLIATLVFTGLRHAEALGLEWNDVGLASGILRVRGTKTAAAERQIVMLPAGREYLSEWRAECSQDSRLVFPTGAGTEWSQSNVRSRILIPAVEASGGPHVTVHGLRRTFASILAALGVPMPEAQAALGHTSPTMTLAAYARPFSPEGLHALVGVPEPQRERLWGPVFGGNGPRMDPEMERGAA